MAGEIAPLLELVEQLSRCCITGEINSMVTDIITRNKGRTSERNQDFSYVITGEYSIGA